MRRRRSAGRRKENTMAQKKKPEPPELRNPVTPGKPIITVGGGKTSRKAPDGMFLAGGKYAFRVSDFAECRDFFVSLVESDLYGIQMEFCDGALGKTAGFQFWFGIDKKYENAGQDDIPCGTEEKPFENTEDLWRIMIFRRNDGYVYILESSDATQEEFCRASRVSEKAYIAAWREFFAYLKTLG